MIGSKDSENRTLRLHFCCDADLGRVVIGHCGASTSTTMPTDDLDRSL